MFKKTNNFEDKIHKLEQKIERMKLENESCSHQLNWLSNRRVDDQKEIQVAKLVIHDLKAENAGLLDKVARLSVYANRVFEYEIQRLEDTDPSKLPTEEI